MNPEEIAAINRLLKRIATLEAAIEKAIAFSDRKYNSCAEAELVEELKAALIGGGQ